MSSDDTQTKMKMSKTSIITSIICIILFIASITAAAAFQEDFSAVSGKTVYVGECSTVVNKILVKNTGMVTSQYSVSIEGSAEEWVSYAPSAFTLKPGKVEEVFIYIKVPCKSEGKYDLTTTIRTKIGVEKALEQEIIVHETRNVEIIPVVHSVETNPCEAAVFDFDITNNDGFTETYEFHAEPFSEGIVFSANNLTILERETARVKMYVTPSCDIWGNYTIDLTTNAKLSRTEAVTSGFSLEINRNYDFSLVFGDLYAPVVNVTPSSSQHSGAYELCEYEHGAIPVFIENKANIPNTYYINLEGPSWASLSGSETTLAPGQSAYVNINLNPSKPMRVNSSAVLTVESSLGEIEKSETKDIKVDICHIPVIAEETSKIKTYYNESYANLTILNTGSKTSNYQISLEGAGWISVLPSSVELAPGEQGNFYLHLQPTSETAEGKYDVIINAVEGSKQYQKVVTVSLKEPRFANMIFDEYLPYTIGIIILLVLCSIGMVGFMVYLDRTKDQRAKAAEKRGIAREKRRQERIRAKEKRTAERERLKLARQKEKEKRLLEKLKAKEKRKLDKEVRRTKKQQEREKRKLEKEKKKGIKITASKKTVAKPKQTSKFKWKKWLLWIASVVIILVILILVYKGLSNFSLYKWYLAGGAIAVIVIVILLILGEYILSKWYKEQVWKTLVPNQKGVLVLTWSKGLGEIVIRLKKSIEDARMKVKRNFWRPTFVAAGDKVYQYFEIRKTNFENRDIEKVSFRFKVKKSWLRRHNIPEKTVKLARYNNEQWTGIRTDIIMDDWRYVYFEAVASGCSMFAIIGKPKPKPVEKPKKPETIIKIVEKPKIIEKIVEKKVIVEKRIKVKPKKRKSEVDWDNLMKIAGFVLLALIVLGIVGFAVYYAVNYTPSEDNTTIADNDSLDDTLDQNITIDTNVTVEDNITAPVNDTEPAVNDTNITAEPEEGPGLWQRIKGFFAELFTSDEEADDLNATMNVTADANATVDDDNATEYVSDDTQVVVDAVNGTEPESQVNDTEPADDNITADINATVDDNATNITAEPEEGPGLWQRIKNFFSGLFTADEEPVDTNVTVDNVTADTNVTLNITAPVNDTEPAVNDTNITAEPEYIDEEGIPASEWDEDTKAYINLSAYFQDPDNDELAFSHSQLEHVSISFDSNGIAELTPERNWHGTEFVVFTADDTKGGNVSSNTVRLTVNDVEEEPLMDRLKDSVSTYSNYVMVGVLILVILILLIEFRKPIMKFLEED